MTSSIEKAIDRLVKKHAEKESASDCEEGVESSSSAGASQKKSERTAHQIILSESVAAHANSGTAISTDRLGEILLSLGKLNINDFDKIFEYQREKDLNFGGAAVALNLVDQSDIQHALSIQFGYSYDQNEESLSEDMVMAYSPFGEKAEVFRTIRGQLLNCWLEPEQKTLAIISPETKEGRSYVAANLAMAFSQLGKSTLLIDADMRAPSQHKLFNFTRKLGLSLLLSGRAKKEDLYDLPEQIGNIQHLSVLGSGAIPPNPAELLSRDAFPLILRELKKFFDVIIIDTPPANFQADVVAIASTAGSALLVAKQGQTRMDNTKELLNLLEKVKVNVVGSVLNQF